MPHNLEPATPIHALVGVQLRAPRVAVVFEGGADWHFWARAAIRQITRSWAGSGFVLVPHLDGRIHPAVAEWVLAYDPDFVVTATQTRCQLESLHPGAVAPERSADPDTLAQSDQVATRPASEAARAWLSGQCTPYARWDGGIWDEDHQELTGGDHDDQGLTGQVPQIPALARVAGVQGVCLAVPGSWGGSVATAAASVVGALDGPQPNATGTDDDAAVLAFLLGVPHSPPPISFVYSPTGIGMSVDVCTQPTALDATRHGLTWVCSPGMDRRRWWVVGGGADDFAVAMIMTRLHRDTVWIDPAWFDNDPLAAILRRAAAPRKDEELTLTSIVISHTDLTQLAATLRPAEVPPVADIHTPPPASPVQLRDRRKVHHLAVQGQHDRRHSLPVLTRPDGSIELAATPPLPTVEPGHPLDTTLMPVQVDLHVPGSVMPAGRGLDAHAFAGEDLEHYHTWVRSSRTGLSYQSTRFDWVSTGASQYGRLATPRLSVPGLRPWVTQMAHQAGFGVRTSDAGRHTDILARLWGGREAMTAAIASPIREALASFTPPPQMNQDSYLDDQAVRIIKGRGVLTFTGLRSHWPDSVNDLTVRRAVDELAQQRILRRGLLLRCPDCLRLDFYPVEDLAQQMVCDQCGASVSLIQASWHKPEQEPRWFYDAHPLARGLVPTNSDVPLLLAAHLTANARVHSHIGEIELTTGKTSDAETDLIALTDEILSVAEVKTNTNLAAGGRLERAIEKRILAAQVIRADHIILATTRQEWPDATVTAMQNAIKKADWVARPPALRLITGLRAKTVDDVTR